MTAPRPANHADAAAALSGWIEAGVHILWQRVYYEDTDAEGIVYYANYLRFAERARSEMLRCLGIGQAALRERAGVGFVVKDCQIAYRRPAGLDDLLELRTWLAARTRVQLTMVQAVRNAADGAAVADMRVNVVCVDMASGRPARLPATVAEALAVVDTG